MVPAIVVFAIAALMFFITWLAWTGRRREWAYRWSAAPRASPVTIVPALGVAMIVAGLSVLGLYEAGSAFGASGLLALVAGLLLSFVDPAWWGPRWYRELKRAEKVG